MGRVIQFILVNVQEVTEFGFFGKNITPNIQEEKTSQWILVCTKLNYIPKKRKSLGTHKNISLGNVQSTFSPFQHRAGPWPVKSRQQRKAKSHSAQAAVDDILGNYYYYTFQGTHHPSGLSPTGDPDCCSAAAGKGQSCRSLWSLPLLVATKSSSPQNLRHARFCPYGAARAAPAAPDRAQNGGHR